jgi:transcriptional regulator
MYVPRHFEVEDLDRAAALVDRIGAADLVTFDGVRPVSTLLPVLWDRPDGGHGRLLGHIALANDQWRTAAPGAQALAVVRGPQAYVSPSWYASKREHGRVVPTWNYTAVHLTGPVTFSREPERLREIVTRLTERHEAGRAHPWAVTDAPAAYLEGQLRGIVAVELTVERVEAKDKLSQNRSRADQEGVVAGLRGDGPESGAVADLMAHRLAADPRDPA